MPRTLKFAPVVVAFVVFALWFIVTEFGIISRFVLPHPADVVHYLVNGLRDGFLISSAGQTLLSALLGSLLALAIGIPLGFAIAHLRIFSAAFEPYLAASQAIPAVAFAPLLVLWVGYGTLPIVLLCALMVVFPIVINTTVGIRSIDHDLLDAARLDGAGKWQLIRSIEFPLSLPTMLAGIRTGFTLSVTGAVVGELVVGGRRGLGTELTTAQHMNDSTGMFATIIILAILAVAIYLALRYLERITIDRVS